MSRWKWLAVLAPIAPALLAACTQKNPEYDAMSAPPPPPAAVLGPALDSVPLTAKLARMQSLLDDALQHGTSGEGSARIVAVKLVADRLLEVPVPFPWMKAGYSTEAKLRQIQALADRVLSELRRDDVDPDLVHRDTRALRASVVRFRADLTQGGAPPPPSMDSLLATVPRTAKISGQAQAVDE